MKKILLELMIALKYNNCNVGNNNRQGICTSKREQEVVWVAQGNNANRNSFKMSKRSLEVGLEQRIPEQKQQVQKLQRDRAESCIQVAISQMISLEWRHCKLLVEMGMKETGRGRSDRRAGRVLALHVLDLSAVTGIPHGPPEQARKAS